METQEQITQDKYETETGTMFIVNFPKGILNKSYGETHAIHITDFRKLGNFLMSDIIKEV